MVEICAPNKRGTTLRTKKTHNTHYFIALASLFIFAMALMIAFPVGAQNNQPTLSLIDLNEQTNNEEALDIAKRLVPDFFEVNQNTFDKDPVFYADYVNLHPDNPKRFIALTAQNSLYYCTNHGCPFYVFYNRANNKWVQVLSVQTHSMFYDISTEGNKPRNIITVGNEMAQRKLRVWLWNGVIYEEVSKN